MLDAPPGRHEDAAIHEGPVPEVDEVPGGDDPASCLGTNLNTKLCELTGLETDCLTD